MTAMTGSPESRLYAAGFTRQLEWWVAPDGSRVMNMADAIAGSTTAPSRRIRPCVP